MIDTKRWLAKCRTFRALIIKDLPIPDDLWRDVMGTEPRKKDEEKT